MNITGKEVCEPARNTFKNMINGKRNTYSLFVLEKVVEDIGM
jgi:hypothetical protein